MMQPQRATLDPSARRHAAPSAAASPAALPAAAPTTATPAAGRADVTAPAAAQVAPLSRATVLLFAAASGLSVANVYFAHPMLDAIARDFGLRHGSEGIVVTAGQAGYALGLLALVPLGDLVNRRRLIVSHLLLSIAALIALSAAPTVPLLLASMFAVGLLAVVVQTLVAFAATLAAPHERGTVVGIVTSGIILGILLARVMSGLLSDLSGWRSVYLVSAGLTGLMAIALFRALPRHQPDAGAVTATYPQLLRSVFLLFKEEPLLRRRAAFGFLIFATFSVFWTSLVLPLTAPPHALSHAAVGMFGLIGVIGALGAGPTGALVDRGLAHWTTGAGLGLLLLAWLPLSLTQHSLWALVIGVIILDLGVQAVHVTNQGLIFAIRPEARSRLVAGYMVFYSLGSGLGSIASTTIYAQAGWSGVCALGAGISAAALLVWLVTPRAPQPTRPESSAPAAQ